MIGIIGPTASGKTSLAVAIAAKIGGEIISADSRQVYIGMDIGTGKDIAEFTFKGKSIPYHLIDIKDPGYEYNVFEYQEDFFKAYDDILNRNAQPILCGGSGMYIEAVLKGYKLIKVPTNTPLRNRLADNTDDELVEILNALKSLHNKSDTSNRDRLLRAIEIELYYKEHENDKEQQLPKIDHKLFAIHFERPELKERITYRLKERLKNGMVEEVEGLLNKGITADQLKFYGLEYKFLSQYVLGEINYNDMYQKLNSAIHQFAKRQMTWFRRMEKNGIHIEWIPGAYSLDEKVGYILSRLK